MTKNEFEMLRICRSAELAYFLSEHSLEKPKFVQQWFKSKVKNDRDSLTTEQMHLICSEWQLKQKNFYKKYKGFTEHHNKAIQSLQFLDGQSDFSRIESFCQQLSVIGVTVLNGLQTDIEVDKTELPPLTQGGLVIIEKSRLECLNDDQNIIDQLTLEISTYDAKRFHSILDIIKLHGFNVADKGKYIIGEAIATNMTSSVNNPVNIQAASFEHDREKDWRDELLASLNKS